MKIKRTSLHRLIAMAMLVLPVFVTDAFAKGTPAGTIILSRSRATFTSAGGTSVDTVYSASVSITVKQIGSFNITPATNSSVTNSDSVSADYAVSLTNSGNGGDTGRLSSLSSKGWITQIYADANGDGILQPGEVSAGIVSQTGSMTADTDFRIVVRVRVPRDEMLDGEKDTTLVTVKSDFDSAKTSTGVYITEVSTAMVLPGTGLTVNNPVPSAGTNVTYTYAYTNNGSVPVNGMAISDLFPGSAFTFVSGTGSQGSFNGSSNPVVWDIGSVAPGSSVTVTLTLLVNANNLPGAIVGNYFSIDYTVGANDYIIATNIQEITVSGVLAPGVEVTPMWGSLSSEATDTALYRFNVQNTGTVKDVIEMSARSTRGFKWTLYRDGNNNARFDTSDPELTDTNGSGDVDVDSVAAGDSVRVFAHTVVARQAIDKLQDTLEVKGFAASDNSKSDIASVVTTVNSPSVSLSKSVFPAGDHPAGAVITYTITFQNGGSAPVRSFVVEDTTPSPTEYIRNSVVINGSAVADNTGPLSVTDVGENKAIAVHVGGLNAGESGTIEFKVKIK